MYKYTSYFLMTYNYASENSFKIDSAVAEISQNKQTETANFLIYLNRVYLYTF